MSIAAMSLGLPPDIDAEVFAIESGADDLDKICLTMYGRSEGLDGQFNGAANQFTDLIAWDISSASAKELESWRDAGGSLTHGAAVLRLWAEDIKEYRRARARLYERWETAKTEAQSRVDSPVVSAGTSGRTGGLAEGLFNAATSTKATREASEKTALIGLACELALEHDTAWGILMDQAEQVRKDLREGPSEATLERLIAAGYLGWNQVGFLSFGDVPLGEIAGNANPGAVNTWWNSLSDSERESAMAEHPDLLRDLDGIPAAVRDRLNREHLDTEIEELEEEVARAQEERDEAMGAVTDTEGGTAAYSAQNELTELKEDLELLTELRNSLEDETKDMYLLALDGQGSGRSIISEGNPDFADNVATLVPGMTNSWKDIPETMARGENLNSHVPGGDTAVISWHGYAAPFNGEGSENQFNYGAAGEDLAAFQEGLRATHEKDKPSNNSVFGHSWGTMVVGHGDSKTGEHGLNADSIAFVGGPGAGVESAAEFSTPEENVHVIMADKDIIAAVDPFRFPGTLEESLGTSFYDEEFFTSDPGSPGGIKGNYHDSQHVQNGESEMEKHGHSGYFYEESVLTYMGGVVGGR
ncbi:alpha/beta hydrolase [Nocardiopsis eucommiae]|uniref:alpha/beta hydrolase n=1 Tax=Nocardiopsis eucommiae TaxID=2831970 RepID=UPI003D71D7C9